MDAPTAEASEHDDLKMFIAMLAAHEMAHAVLLLALGRAFVPQPLPSRYDRGPTGRCYETSLNLALADSGLAYVEGYALPRGLIPVAHAWCVTEDGRVIDATWKMPGQAAYHGVALDVGFVARQVQEQGCYGVFAEFTPRQLLHSGVNDLLDERFPPAQEGLRRWRTWLATRGLHDEP